MIVSKLVKNVTQATYELEAGKARRHNREGEDEGQELGHGVLEAKGVDGEWFKDLERAVCINAGLQLQPFEPW